MDWWFQEVDFELVLKADFCGVCVCVCVCVSVCVCVETRGYRSENDPRRSRRAVKRIPSVALWSRRAVKRIPSVAL